MELLGPTWRQRLSYGACAIAVVCTLSVYKSSTEANPLSTAHRPREAKDATTYQYAIIAGNLERLVIRYSHNGIVTLSKTHRKEWAPLAGEKAVLFQRLHLEKPTYVNISPETIPLQAVKGQLLPPKFRYKALQNQKYAE